MTLNQEVGEVADLDTASVSEEQATEDVSLPEVEVATETEGQTNETGEEPKRGAQQRIRELNTRAKIAEERAKSLEERLAELTGRVDQSGYTPQFNPQEPVIKPGEEIDAAEFERRVMQRANATIELKLKQQEAISRINSESTQSMRKYPELDPESEYFNKDLSDSVTEAVEAHVRANPYSASVKTFVDKLMKPYKGAVTKEVGKATENLAKQVSEAALRPATTMKTGEKSDSELTPEELEKKYGIVY